MFNKRGNHAGGIWAAIVLVAIVAVLFIADASSDSFDIIPRDEVAGNLAQEPVSFGDALQASAFGFLDYIFGKIPGHLISITENDISAAIVVIAIWVMFLLIFADIVRLFGTFSAGVNWVIAVLLVIIGANLKFISVITVYSLTVLAILGAFSVIASIGFIFILFILFHFGSLELRRWIILRRAQDEALKAVAGGKKAASGITVLSDIVEEARRAGRRF